VKPHRIPKLLNRMTFENDADLLLLSSVGKCDCLTISGGMCEDESDRFILSYLQFSQETLIHKCLNAWSPNLSFKLPDISIMCIQHISVQFFQNL
jgi:hypothetical protein